MRRLKATVRKLRPGPGESTGAGDGLKTVLPTYPHLKRDKGT